jgi:hypothetical protein
MKKQIIFAGLLLLSWGLRAQEVVPSQGDTYTNSSISMDFTIGEVIINTVTDGSNDLTQGFHQTSLIITNVEDLETNFLVNLFPNPTAEMVTLSIEKYQGVTYRLFDAIGKLLKEALVTESNTTVNVSDYPKGAYLLTLTEAENKKIKTYKIIKK